MSILPSEKVFEAFDPLPRTSSTMRGEDLVIRKHGRRALPALVALAGVGALVSWVGTASAGTGAGVAYAGVADAGSVAGGLARPAADNPALRGATAPVGGVVPGI